MSVIVSAYVWEHSRQKGSALLLLLAIADHAHDDGTGAYPSVANLAKKMRMTQRNTQRLIQQVIEAEELLSEPGAGPHGVNIYSIPMGVTTFHPDTTARGAPDAMGGVTSQTQGDDPGVTQTIREPSKNRQSPLLPAEQPDWYTTLTEIPGFKVTLANAQGWLDKKGIDPEYAETTAYALKSKWPGPKKDPYKDPWATFQGWVTKPPLGGSNNGTTGRHTEEAGSGDGRARPGSDRPSTFAEFR